MGKNALLADECNDQTSRDGFVYREIDAAADGLSQSLPYETLGGEGFERLCYLYLLSRNKNPHFFARSGQADYGVDLTTSAEDGFTLYQCKNWATPNRKIPESEYLSVFEDFNRRWVSQQGLPKPGSFILCTSALVGKDKDNHQAFQNAADYFAECFKEEWGNEIRLDFLDRTSLDDVLKDLPHVVADVFSEKIAALFCGKPEDDDFGVFIPVHPGQGDKRVRHFYEQRDRLFIPDRLRDGFDEKLREYKKLLIKGFPGTGKTTVSLDLASGFEVRCGNLDKRCYVYYVNMKSSPSPEVLKKGILRRRSIPSVFIFDDCQAQLETVKALNFFLDGIMNNWEVYGVYIYRTSLTEKEERDEDAGFFDFFEDTVLEFKNDEELFSGIIAKRKPELRGIDIDELLHFTGRDLWILDFALQSMSSPGDFEEFKSNRDILYKKVIERYFGAGTRYFKGILKVAALAQFDIGIHPGFYNKEILPEVAHPKTKEFLDKMVVQAGHPPTCYFLHSSLAELICRAAVHINREDFSGIVVSSAVSYFCYLAENKRPGDEFRQSLYFFLKNPLQLPENNNENVAIKRDFLHDKDILQLVKDNFEKINPNSIAGMLTFLESDELLNNYLSLLENKIENDKYIDTLIGHGSAASGYFYYLLRKQYRELFEMLQKLLNEDRLKSICNNGNFPYFVKMLTYFFEETDRERMDVFLGALTTRDIDELISTTVIQKNSIGTVNLVLRELKKKGLLELVEAKIGKTNYLKLIERNGTFFELIHFLRDSTIKMAGEIIDGLSPEYVAAIIDKTIKQKRSIGTIHLGLKDLDKKGLLKKLEKKIDWSDYLRLIKSNGTFFELIDFLRDSTTKMAGEIIDGLSLKYVAAIIDKTIRQKRSIGSIHYGFRDLKKAKGELNHKLESKLGIDNLKKLILATSDPGVLPNLLKSLSINTEEKLIETLNSLPHEEKETFILKGDFRKLCYAQAEYPSLALLHPARPDRISEVKLPVRQLLEQSNFGSINAGLGNLANTPDRQLKQFLTDRAAEYIDSLEPEKVPFETQSEKINYLSILNRFERLDETILKKTVNQVDMKQLLKEKNALIPLRFLLNQLAVYDTGETQREAILGFSNDGATAEIVAKESLLRVFLFLWNQYTLFSAFKPGPFHRWLNPEILRSVLAVIGNNCGLKPEANEYPDLMKLIGLMDALRIGGEETGALFPSHYRVDLSKPFLSRVVEKSTFLPGYFFLKGVEFFHRGPVNSSYWRQLEPKIEQYQQRKPKALLSLIDDYKSRYL